MVLARYVNHKVAQLAALSNAEREANRPKKNSVMMEMQLMVTDARVSAPLRKSSRKMSAARLY
jgi:hypothetical protein